MCSQHSSNFGTGILDKKVQQNPRYKHVKPVVNTGNVCRREDILAESYRNNPYRIQEVFKRLKLSTFVKLIIQINHNEFVDDLLIDFGGTKSPISEKKEENKESLTPLQGVLVGIGEWDRKKEKNEETLAVASPPTEIVTSSLPYLLLDVRTNEEYKLCHIKTAKNYPSSLLSRSVGYETKDLLNYKNMSRKFIVLYDEEETLAARVGTTLVQRGYDNIFILCGGLKKAQEKFPRGLINGVFLPPLEQKKLLAKSTLTTPDATKCAFKDNFTEDDIHILELTLDLTFATRGAKPSSSSYTDRSKFSQRPSTESRHRSVERLQRLQKSARRACSSTSKPIPWK